MLSTILDGQTLNFLFLDVDLSLSSLLARSLAPARPRVPYPRRATDTIISDDAGVPDTAVFTDTARLQHGAIDGRV